MHVLALTSSLFSRVVIPRGNYTGDFRLPFLFLFLSSQFFPSSSFSFLPTFLLQFPHLCIQSLSSPSIPPPIRAFKPPFISPFHSPSHSSPSGRAGWGAGATPPPPPPPPAGNLLGVQKGKGGDELTKLLISTRCNAIS